MVVFVHDFGNLRVETQHADSVEANLESSYMVGTLFPELLSIIY